MPESCNREEIEKSGTTDECTIYETPEKEYTSIQTPAGRPIPGKITGDNCNDDCAPKLDLTQVFNAYDDFDKRIRESLQADYDCKKITGTVFAATWSDMMKIVISSSMQAVSSMHNNETVYDRAVKQENIESSIVKSNNEVDITIVKVAVEEADVNLKLQAIDSARLKADLDKATTESKCAVDSEIIVSSREKTISEAILTESKCEVNTESIASSRAKTINEDKLSTSKITNDKVLTDTKKSLDIANKFLINSKAKAEDIKNGDLPDTGIEGESLYGHNKSVLGAQETLYSRQTVGFDDNARQKLLDSQISAWSIVWKEGSALDIPCAISNKAINHTLDNINDDMGKTATNGTIPTNCTQPA